MIKQKWIECVPNFSEGRNPEVIEGIRQSIQDTPGCELWDSGSDPDHNRSVFTIAGTPDALTRAVLSFTKKAAKTIDMRTHEGVHPCIGATDVIPFIPLLNTDMEECIALSEQVGARIAEELNLPVYLYARSARCEAHRRLADIRRGGYSRLSEVIATDPDRAPDFGPKLLPPAGGVSIGARDYLVAFNVYLDSDNVRYAKAIAKAIRESSGGIPGVQAIGLQVKGLAQVSMNILNYRTAPLKRVYEAIKKKAGEMNIQLGDSELIGLLPRAALTGTNAVELRICDFSEARIIENHLG